MTDASRQLDVEKRKSVLASCVVEVRTTVSSRRFTCEMMSGVLRGALLKAWMSHLSTSYLMLAPAPSMLIVLYAVADIIGHDVASGGRYIYA